MKPKGEMRNGKLVFFMADESGNQVGPAYGSWEEVWAVAQGQSPVVLSGSVPAPKKVQRAAREVVAPRAKLNTYLLWPIMAPGYEWEGSWLDEEFKVEGTRPPTVGALDEQGRPIEKYINWNTDTDNWLVGTWFSGGSGHYEVPGALRVRIRRSVIAVQAPDEAAARQVAASLSPQDLTYTLSVPLDADPQGRELPWNLRHRYPLKDFEVDVQILEPRILKKRGKSIVVEKGREYYVVAENIDRDKYVEVVEGTDPRWPDGRIGRYFWDRNARPGESYDVDVFGPLQIVKTIKWKGATSNPRRRSRKRSRR
jgi:hypothetical protein